MPNESANDRLNRPGVRESSLSGGSSRGSSIIFRLTVTVRHVRVGQPKHNLLLHHCCNLPPWVAKL